MESGGETMTSRPGRHIETERLLELLDGGARPLGVGAHLETCADCRKELAVLERLLDDMRSDRTAEPPAAALARATAIFPDRPSITRRVVETIARLVGETLAAPATLATAGVRGEVEGARLQFTGEGLDVDVELTGHPGMSQLTAQAIAGASSAAPALAWLDHDGQTSCERPFDEAGTIHFDELPDGPFALVIDLGDRRLRLPIRAEDEG